MLFTSKKKKKQNLSIHCKEQKYLKFCRTQPFYCNLTVSSNTSKMISNHLELPPTAVMLYNLMIIYICSRIISKDESIHIR